MARRYATIIGSKGFIGSALEAHLIKRGWSVWAPSRNESWPQVSRHLGHVFYCAGLTVDFQTRPADTINAHVSLLSKVLESDSYESLVYLSSTRVYDTLPKDSVALEDAWLKVNPGVARQLYDLSKLTGEVLCYALGAGRARVARLSCVYGEASVSGGFLPELLHQVDSAHEQEALAVASSPFYKRDYVYLSDVLRAMVDIATLGKHPSYNVASGNNVSNLELADCILSLTGKRIEFQKTDKATDTPIISVDRLVGEFGWRPIGVSERLRTYYKKGGT